MIRAHRLVLALVLTLGLSATAHAAQGTKVTDPQIMGVLAAANHSEIAAGKLAEEQSTRKDVKKFATDMVKAHTKMDEEGTKLAKKLKITAEDSAASNEIRQGGQEALTKLKGMKGAEFDQAYADGQVADHQKVLDTIDNTLLPSATDRQLKGMLKKARSTVASHLKHAEKLQEKVKKEGNRAARNDH